MAKRIQRKRVKGWKMPANAVSVTRPGRYGNPYTVRPIGLTEWIVYEWDEMVGTKTRVRALALAECLDLYRKWVELQVALEPDFLAPLRGKDLACFCPLDQPCHADTLIEFANQEQEVQGGE